MIPHPDDRLLARFVDGDLPDEAAADLAVHLDGCPRCAARMNQIDPLVPLFARAPDPVAPPIDVADLLARAAAPARPRRPAWVAAGAIASAAAALLLVVGPLPGGGLAELGLVAARPAVGGVLPGPAAALLSGGGLLLAVWALRRARGDRGT
jgi:anti-sigma factor RsiW